MDQVTIDGIVYDLEVLSDTAKQQLGNLKITDTEISRLKNQLSIANTARAAYANVLKVELQKIKK